MKVSPSVRLLLFLLLLPVCSWGQDLFTISGYVKDAETGETLINASIYLETHPSTGIATNTYGFYALNLEPGTYTLVYSYLGYQDVRQTIELNTDLRLNINLSQGLLLKEVVVTDEQTDENVSDTQMGTVDLETDQVKKLPSLMGEIDILKTIQLLPGVLSAGEGNAGFYVRGGGPDQNLVLLDEAVVYNSGHLLGFFSVFNADAIKNTTLIKGGMPAIYGGRLSSVVDVQMREGNNKNFAAQGGIGLIASRLTVEGPLQKDKSSFLLSGRRTYAFDLAQPFLKNSTLVGTNYYFYDLNTKANYIFSDKDRLFISGYFGRDVLQYVTSERDFSLFLPYGNATATLRWNHLFNQRLFMNTSLIYNDYSFEVEAEQSDFTVNLFSGVRDYNAKIDLDYFASRRHHFKFGLHYTYHKLTPNIAEAVTSDQAVLTNDLEPKFAHESSIYIQDEFELGSRFRINAGLRLNWFAQIGPYESSLDRTLYGKGEIVRSFLSLEPRLNMRYQLNTKASLKGAITVSNQYLHLVSNSTTTLPLDIWVPSSELVEPQLGIQYAAGFFQNLAGDNYETSVEVYYKDLRRQIDYRESYVNNPGVNVEEDFVFGSGRAYGLELFLKKRTGNVNGWIGYTLSKTERWFDDIEEGRVFPTVYDRAHDLSVALSYQPNPKWSIGLVFVYGTGRAYTPIQSLYLIEQNLVPNYGPRNSARLENYHRLDLSATFTPKPSSKKAFTSNWTFAIYNMYNRRNPFFLYYKYSFSSENGRANAQAIKFSLFPIIPSITWNFKWNPGQQQ